MTFIFYILLIVLLYHSGMSTLDEVEHDLAYVRQLKNSFFLDVAFTTYFNGFSKSGGSSLLLSSWFGAIKLATDPLVNVRLFGRSARERLKRPFMSGSCETLSNSVRIGMTIFCTFCRYTAIFEMFRSVGTEATGVVSGHIGCQNISATAC